MLRFGIGMMFAMLAMGLASESALAQKLSLSGWGRSGRAADWYDTGRRQ